MTNPNKTAIQIVVDRSGSMSTIAQDMSGALNSYIADQAKEAGECLVSLSDFDNEVTVHAVDQPVADWKDYSLWPRNMTALNDAIGQTITALGQRLDSLDDADRPGKVVFVIITDGGENASKEYKDPTVIKKMIETQQTDYGWQFLYLGANQDAFAVAGTYGIDRGSTVSYGATAQGSAFVGQTISRATTDYRSGAAVAANFTAEEQAAGQSTVTP